MGVKLYISGISGSKEVKKKQQRIMMILESKKIEYEVIDITEPGREPDKEYMQQMSTSKDGKNPLPPQIFNDDDYCGDYDEFDVANENDKVEGFLKLPVDSLSKEADDETVNNVRQNGNASSREASTDKDVSVANSVSETEEKEHSTVEDSEIEKSKSVDLEESAKSVDEDLENTDKNEEKSDGQEKEE